MSPLVVGGIPNPPPYAPGLGPPANASYADLSGAVTFAWTPRGAVPGSVQSGWAFRQKVSGGASYVFWNNGTSAWQSTLVWNSGSSSSFTFPSGAWIDGNVYNWSVATMDANGNGPFATDDTITAQAGPVVTVLSPSGTVATAQPIAAWSVSLPVGAQQTGYRVVYYTAAQQGVAGFTAGVSPSTWDSGLLGGAYVSTLPLATPPAGAPEAILLVSGVSYYCYIMVTETGGQSSAWASSAFTCYFEGPQAPTFTVTPGTDPLTGAPMNTLTVNCHDNWLPPNDALGVSAGNVALYTNPGWWVAGVQSGLGTGSPVTTNGIPAVAVTSMSSGGYCEAAFGDPNFSTLTQAATLPPAGTAIEWIVDVQPQTTQRTVQLAAHYWTAAGAGVGATLSAGTMEAPPGTTTTVTMADVVPVGATLGTLIVVFGLGVAATGETHYIIDAALSPAGTTTWGPGGLAGSTSVTAIFSDDDGTTWWPVRGAAGVAVPSTQVVTILDYEAAQGFQRQYQVVVTAPAGANVLASPVATASATMHDTLRWWLKDPLNPSANMLLSLAPGTLETDHTDRQQIVPILGRPDPVILSDAFGLPSISATFVFTTDVAYQAFEALRATQHILLFQGPNPAGQWYVRLGAAKHDSTNLPSLRGQSTNNGVVRTVAITMQAVGQP